MFRLLCWDSDPGILFDLYGGYTSYTIPGPAVYVPGSSTGSPTTVSNTGTTPTSTSTSASATATGPVAVKYAQCGGIGWTGATQCITGTTCTKLNDVSPLIVCALSERPWLIFSHIVLLPMYLSCLAGWSRPVLHFGLPLLLYGKPHCRNMYLCTTKHDDPLYSYSKCITTSGKQSRNEKYHCIRYQSKFG